MGEKQEIVIDALGMTIEEGDRILVVGSYGKTIVGTFSHTDNGIKYINAKTGRINTSMQPRTFKLAKQ